MADAGTRADRPFMVVQGSVPLWVLVDSDPGAAGFLAKTGVDLTLITPTIKILRIDPDVSRRGAVQGCSCQKSFSIGSRGRWQGLRHTGNSRLSSHEYFLYLFPLLRSHAIHRELRQHTRGQASFVHIAFHFIMYLGGLVDDPCSVLVRKLHPIGRYVRSSLCLYSSGPLQARGQSSSPPPLRPGQRVE